MAWSEAFLGELRFLVGCFLQMSEVFRKLSEEEVVQSFRKVVQRFSFLVRTEI